MVKGSAGSLDGRAVGDRNADGRRSRRRLLGEVDRGTLGRYGDLSERQRAGARFVRPVEGDDGALVEFRFAILKGAEKAEPRASGTGGSPRRSTTLGVSCFVCARI